MNEKQTDLEQEYAKILEDSKQHPIDARVIRLEQEIFRLNQKISNSQPVAPSREVIGAPAISANSTTSW